MLHDFSVWLRTYRKIFQNKFLVVTENSYSMIEHILEDSYNFFSSGKVKFIPSNILNCLDKILVLFVFGCFDCSELKRILVELNLKEFFIN